MEYKISDWMDEMEIERLEEVLREEQPQRLRGKRKRLIKQMLGAAAAILFFVGIANWKTVVTYASEFLTQVFTVYTREGEALVSSEGKGWIETNWQDWMEGGDTEEKYYRYDSLEAAEEALGITFLKPNTEYDYFEFREWWQKKESPIGAHFYKDKVTLTVPYDVTVPGEKRTYFYVDMEWNTKPGMNFGDYEVGMDEKPTVEVREDGGIYIVPDAFVEDTIELPDLETTVMIICWEWPEEYHGNKREYDCVFIYDDVRYHIKDIGSPSVTKERMLEFVYSLNKEVIEN